MSKPCAICAGCESSDDEESSSGSEWSCSDENCSVKSWSSVSDASWKSDDTDYSTESEHEHDPDKTKTEDDENKESGSKIGDEYDKEDSESEKNGSDKKGEKKMENEDSTQEYPKEIKDFITQSQDMKITEVTSKDFGKLSANEDTLTNNSAESSHSSGPGGTEVKKDAGAVMASLATNKRTKRYASYTSHHYHKRGYRRGYRRRGYYRPRGSGQGSSKTRYRGKRYSALKSYMQMPTGKHYPITMPPTNNWSCGMKTKLINLRPTGRTGRREYMMVSSEMTETKRDHATGEFKSYEIIKIEKVVNPCMWKRYRHRRREVIGEVGEANERLMFHGSLHIDELVAQGFDERYSNLNGMFGAGLYFAINSSKSNQYVYGLSGTGCELHYDKNCDQCVRRMLLCRVIQGKVKKLTASEHLSHAPPDYHSVEGVPTPGVLQYQENIVYRGEQVYPEYLISYKIVK